MCWTKEIAAKITIQACSYIFAQKIFLLPKRLAEDAPRLNDWHAQFGQCIVGYQAEFSEGEGGKKEWPLTEEDQSLEIRASWDITRGRTRHWTDQRIWNASNNASGIQRIRGATSIPTPTTDTYSFYRYGSNSSAPQSSSSPSTTTRNSIVCAFKWAGLYIENQHHRHQSKFFDHSQVLIDPPPISLPSSLQYSRLHVCTRDKYEARCIPGPRASSVQCNRRIQICARNTRLWLLFRYTR